MQWPSMQVPSTAITNQPQKKRGRPAKNVGGQDISKKPCSTKCMTESPTETVMGAPKQEDPTQVLKPNLHVKTEHEVFKEEVIGKPLELLPVSKLPLKRLILQRVRLLCFH